MLKIVSKNPMTEEVLWEGNEASADEINKAIESAKKAQVEWSSLSISKRELFLKRFQENLKSSQESIATTISKETGKPLWESRQEVSAMISKVDISIDAQKVRCAETQSKVQNGISITRHKPLGVVAVFGPFNFPGHLPNGHIVPALLAGNTIIFKPSEQTPLVAIEILKLWNQAGLPEGVLNIIQGGAYVGKLIAEHKEINALYFTGSFKTGQILAKYFGEHPNKLLALEMGGNNPLVIFEISDYKAAAYLAIQSAFITSGQRCTCARRLILPQGIEGDSFLKVLVEMTQKIQIGAYNESPEPFMGPVINNASADHILDFQSSLMDKGAKPILLSKRLRNNIPLISPGILDVTGVKNRSDEELFGPLLQVIRVPDFESAIKEAGHTSFGLAATILTDNKERYTEFYNKAHAGIVNWNTQTTGASSLAPFGGIGNSGNFRPSAFYAADYCNYPVASIEVEKLTLPTKLAPGIKE